MGFGRRGWPLLIGEGRRYLEVSFLGCSGTGIAACLLVPTLQRGNASTSACSSFGSPRKDEGGEIQTLHFLSGPGGFPQKVQAGFHRRVALETLNFNPGGEFFPAVVINKLHDHTLKRDAMEGVLRLLAIHTCRPSFARWFSDAQRCGSQAANT